MPQTKTDAILAKLDELKTEQHKTAAVVTELNVHIKGNGGKGLHQRMDDLECWAKSRPATCPVDVKAMERRQKWMLAIWGTIVGVITFLANILPPLFMKGG